jgi:Spy/CpxP family protein refolding chaperone
VGTAGVACDKSSGSSATPTTEPQASASAATSASPAPASSSSSASAAEDAAANATAAAAQAEEEEQVADELQSHHRHHHRGFAGFVLSAVETLGIAPEQQAAIDAIRKEFHVKMKPLHEANKAVLQLLADGVAAGNIDKAKVDAAVAKAGTAAAPIPGATADLLTKLHAALRPEQRAALVDKVDAHWATWRDVNGTDHTPDGGVPKADRRLHHITKELGLTSDQLDKFKASLDASSKDVKKPFDPSRFEAFSKAFDAAFVEATFDAKKLPAAGPEAARMVSWGAERMGWFYEALTPILTTDQRTKLADKLRERLAGTPDSKEK